MPITYSGDNIAFNDGSTLASGRMGMVNRLINGRMEIDQRNAGASVTPTVTATYLVDRWQAQLSVASKFSAQQNAGSVTPPAGFVNYLGATSLSAYSIGAGDYFTLSQYIEGFNVADLSWGTANAKTVTLSFQVYSSLTGTFGGSLRNSNATRSYPFTYSIPVANTWTTISITIAGDTTGTWLTNNGIGIQVNFSIGAGSTVSGTAGSWSASNLLSATGATSVVGTSGATFYITGVDLRPGTFTSAPTWEFRSYQQELALCQRYYQKHLGTYAFIMQGYSPAGISVNLSTSTTLPVQMRVTPTPVTIGSWFFSHCSSLTWFASPSVLSGNVQTDTTSNGAGAYPNGTSNGVELTGAEL